MSLQSGAPGVSAAARLGRGSDTVLGAVRLFSFLFMTLVAEPDSLPAFSGFPPAPRIDTSLFIASYQNGAPRLTISTVMTQPKTWPGPSSHMRIPKPATLSHNEQSVLSQKDKTFLICTSLGRLGALLLLDFGYFIDSPLVASAIEGSRDSGTRQSRWVGASPSFHSSIKTFRSRSGASCGAPASALERLTPASLGGISFVVVGAVGWGLQHKLIIGVTMGAIALELLQSFSPGRHVTFEDLLASLAGVVLGCAVAYLAGLVLRRTGLPTALVGSKRRDP